MAVKIKMDGKVYGTLYSEKTGELIPPDEYVVFRTHDRLLLKTLVYYMSLCDADAEQAQVLAVKDLIDRVGQWQNDHPDRMKYPDVEPGEINTAPKEHSLHGKIPDGVYYSKESNNFYTYGAVGRGNEFYAKYKDVSQFFPQKTMLPIQSTEPEGIKQASGKDEGYLWLSGQPLISKEEYERRIASIPSLRDKPFPNPCPGSDIGSILKITPGDLDRDTQGESDLRCSECGLKIHRNNSNPPVCNSCWPNYLRNHPEIKS